jgi:hypothetical protein
MRPLAFALPFLVLAACGRLDEVDVTRSASVTIPGATGGGDLPSGSVSGLRIALGSALLREQGIDPGDVDGARLRRVHVEVTAGSSLETWADAISLHAEGAGLPRVLLAQKTGIRSLPAGTTSLDLDVPATELKPYLDAATAAVTADATGRAPGADTTLKVTATIRVDVNVSGLLR